MDSAQLLALVGALKGRTVAVVGDVVADEFVYGRVARVSREAPVLILEHDTTEVVAGERAMPRTTSRPSGPGRRSSRSSAAMIQDVACSLRCRPASTLER